MSQPPQHWSVHVQGGQAVIRSPRPTQTERLLARQREAFIAARTPWRWSAPDGPGRPQIPLFGARGVGEGDGDAEAVQLVEHQHLIGVGAGKPRPPSTHNRVTVPVS